MEEPPEEICNATRNDAQKRILRGTAFLNAYIKCKEYMGRVNGIGWAARDRAVHGAKDAAGVVCEGAGMINVIDHAEGYIIPVRAQPGARRTGIVGAHAGALKVAVAATPERGKANEAIIEVLRQALGVRGSQIELLSGATSRDKRFLVRGVGKKELARRLEPL